VEHTRFIGLDIHKERISIAVTESGRSGAVEYLGEIANEPGAISKLCDRLRRPGKPLTFCYEAGPCGYGVHRQLTSLGHRCDVVAPSLIPTKAGEDSLATMRQNCAYENGAIRNSRCHLQLGPRRRSRRFFHLSRSQCRTGRLPR
jgi:hypothetical protein